MEKAYVYEWTRLCIEHETYAHKAWKEATTRHKDGTIKSEREYYDGLIELCEELMTAEG